MGCSKCGSSSGCGCGSGCSPVSASQVILQPVPSGVRSCSPLSNTCGTPQPASPTPFYGCTPQCEEDNCKTLVYNYYSASICTQFAFNMPDCGESVNVYFQNVKVLPVGVYIWNESVGYLEVTAFNNQTGLATLLNNCNEGNASAGTQFQACTCFTVTAPPCDCASSSGVFLSTDFTAPAVDECTTISVTSVNGLSEGDTIALGSGTYVIGSIVSSTSISICNTGDGITPGTVVEAENSAGQLQYPIYVVSSCCSNIIILTDDQESSKSSGTILAGASGTFGPATISLSNTSTLNTLTVEVTYNLYGVMRPNATSAETHCTVDLQLSIDGGAFASLVINPFNLGDTAGGQALLTNVAITYTDIYTLAPGGTKSLAFQGVISNLGGNTILVDSVYVRGVAFGIAV